MGVQTYAAVSDSAETPRAQEQRLFQIVTTQLRDARDNAPSTHQLITVIHRNRAMWRAFADACSMPGNQLADETRASIISLALWVDRHSSEVMRGLATIDDLVAVNEDMIAGLNGG